MCEIFAHATSMCYMAYTRCIRYVRYTSVGLAGPIDLGSQAGRRAVRPFWHIVNYLKMIYCKFVYTLPCGCICRRQLCSSCWIFYAASAAAAAAAARGEERASSAANLLYFHLNLIFYIAELSRAELQQLQPQWQQLMMQRFNHKILCSSKGIMPSNSNINTNIYQYLYTPSLHSHFNRVLAKQLKNIDNKLQSQFAIAIELAFCGFAATVNMPLAMCVGVCLFVYVCVCVCAYAACQWVVTCHLQRLQLKV